MPRKLCKPTQNFKMNSSFKFFKKFLFMKLLLHNFLTGIVNLLGDKSHHFKVIQNAILCKKDVDCYSRFLICILDANIDVFASRKKQNITGT